LLRNLAGQRSAGFKTVFQTCCIADFPSAGLSTARTSLEFSTRLQAGSTAIQPVGNLRYGLRRARLDARGKPDRRNRSFRWVNSSFFPVERPPPFVPLSAMHGTAPMISAGEERFEQLRKRSGFFLGPLVFVVLLLFPFSGLTPEAHRVLAVLGLVVTFWVSEAIPLPATALLGPALCVVLGVGPAREVFRSFADPIIFIFIGSFIIAQGMLHHGVNRRIAFQILGLRAIGESPIRLLLAFGGIAGFLSMWVSNTATTAMMFPIGIAILSEMARRQSARTGKAVHFTELRYGTGLMLMAAYASSLGGLGTPVGTPPNLIGIAQIRRFLEIDIPFFHWMLMGVPAAVVMIGFLVVYFSRVCPAEEGLLKQSADWIREERAKLGPVRRGEFNVLLAFGVTVAFWVAPGIVALAAGQDDPVYVWLSRHLPESVVALLGASLLFLLPVNWREREMTMTWREAKNIDWGTILLFGGGLALGELMFSTGLAQWMGEGLAEAMNAHTTLGLVLLFTLVASFVSESASNTASATMVVPVAIAVAQAAGVNPLQPALAACLGASMGFMLPVSTPPNAIVYGSGCVPLTHMVKYGFALNVVGCATVVGIVMWWVPVIFDL
jgi:solute carrier family 13 (sodium-dependent dicarboxylate transporter), member 2/3/5